MAARVRKGDRVVVLAGRDKGKSGENSEMPRAERALQEIRKDILSMAFAPGEPVSERALEERYGMSRTPIRAALAALTAEGLIVRDPRRGYMIAPIDLRARIDHIGKDARRSAKDIIFQRDARIDGDVILDLHVGADLNAG